MKRKIYFDGELAAKYGSEFTMNVDSFGEVFKCLQANIPGVTQYLIECHEKDVGFMCKVGEAPLTDEKELLLQYGEGDMYISPQPMGSKSAGAKILAAAALIAISFFVGGGPFALLGAESATFANVAAFTAFTLGINLALTGVMQLMAPDPATDSQQDEAYLFQGSGQTILEGDPVPILYGKMRIPGRPVSFRVKNENQRFYNSGAQASVSDTGPSSNPTSKAPGIVPPQGAGGGSIGGIGETTTWRLA